jgi:hypothetical protein
MADMFRWAAFIMQLSDDKFLDQIAPAFGEFFKGMHNRYANSKDMYAAVKNLGEDTIAAIELVLMAVSGIGLAIVIANVVQKTLKFAYTFMKKLAKRLKKNTDDFLRSFDIDEAVREAIDDYTREIDDAAKAIPKKKIEINTKAGVVTLEGFYWKRISYIKRSRVEYRKMRTAFGTERKKLSSFATQLEYHG